MQEFFDVQSTALARIERTDALVYFTAERIELFDVREQLAANLFLIGVRQPRNLCNGLFERSDHGPQTSTFRPGTPENLERAKGINPSYAAWETAGKSGISGVIIVSCARRGYN